ncbi:LAETG motif-containing sortase-dependent surface protein [Georgenia deserti]|uniref:LAETG motif-containing sortase-dependent surface protein n=1 Tax=Georgenia deserti TaxID=2093781 RepID=A0ABW4L2Y2_9MICO
MNRRAVVTAAATAGLILVPTSAMADYAETEASVVFEEVSQNPFVFRATVDAGTEYEDGEDVTITVTSEDEDTPDSAIQIAGEQSASETLVDGGAVFETTITQVDTYDVVVTGPDGEVIGSAQVTFSGDDDGGVDDGTDDDGAGAGGGDGSLPDTGASNSTPLIIGAAVLLAAGAGAMVFARTRQTQA